MRKPRKTVIMIGGCWTEIEVRNLRIRNKSPALSTVNCSGQTGLTSADKSINKLLFTHLLTDG
jgi:hypothetical protein